MKISSFVDTLTFLVCLMSVVAMVLGADPSNTTVSDTNTTTTTTSAATTAAPTTDPESHIYKKWWLALAFSIPLSIVLASVCLGMCVCNNRRKEQERQKLLNQKQQFEENPNMQFTPSDKDEDCRL